MNVLLPCTSWSKQFYTTAILRSRAKCICHLLLYNLPKEQSTNGGRYTLMSQSHRSPQQHPTSPSSPMPHILSTRSPLHSVSDRHCCPRCTALNSTQHTSVLPCPCANNMSSGMANFYNNSSYSSQYTMSSIKLDKSSAADQAFVMKKIAAAMFNGVILQLRRSWR